MNKDNTAAKRQQKRKERLADQDIYRKSLLVHTKCNAVFEQLKPYFANPELGNELFTLFDTAIIDKPINVSKVRQLSPFRYPGGKTWLVPEIKKWIFSFSFKPTYFVEPFSGGGIVSLSVAVENLAQKVIMSEIDPDVASVWHTILQNPNFLCNHILNFNVNLENVKNIIDSSPITVEEKAFRTIIKNRTQRGGILAPGASLVKSGENGKGLMSRWYPETLVKRITTIHQFKERISFMEKDAFYIINKYKECKKALFFVDPPYTAGGKNAGKRLYAFNEIDHDKLFFEMAKIDGHFLMTYDNSEDVIKLAQRYNFNIQKIPMKNTHHEVKYELLIKKSY